MPCGPARLHRRGSTDCCFGLLRSLFVPTTLRSKTSPTREVLTGSRTSELVASSGVPSY
jgi:hypothetical protein